MSKRKIEFTVHGVPRPKGSATGFVPVNRQTGEPYRDKGGRIICNVKIGTEKTAAWEALVKHAATEALAGEPILSGPIRATYVFQFQRPKKHFIGNNRELGVLRDNAPADHDHQQDPDGDKLERCVNDALQNAVIVDDNRIVEWAGWKEWFCESSRLHVTVEEI